MPTPNPETHCPTCGEPLSEFHHCWQCHYPPMDPKQDAAQATTVGTKPHHIPCGECGACYTNEACGRLQ